MSEIAPGRPVSRQPVATMSLLLRAIAAQRPAALRRGFWGTTVSDGTSGS